MNAKKEMIFTEKPTRNCHASTVLPMPDGSVYAAWFGGYEEKNDDVDIWYSKRVDGVWSTPEFVSADKKIPHWNPVLFLHNDETVRLFFKIGKQIPTWRTYYSLLKPGETEFSAPVELVKGDRSGGRGPVKNKAIRLQSGRILAPASTENHGWRAFIDVSDDDGVTWKKTPFIKTERTAAILNSDNGFCSFKIPMIQPTLWESEPDTVHMLTRTSKGRAYRSDSFDGGLTWCEAYRTDILNNNSGLDVVNTPHGLFLVSNPIEENWGERSPITLDRSLDNGKTWETVLVMEEFLKDSEYSYPAIQYRDGSLYITYTYNREYIVFWKIEL